MTERPARVVVFDPTPLLTVTLEALGDVDDVHLHAGGQGIWVARMLRELGADVVVCGTLGGETGLVAGRLLEIEGLRLRSVSTAAPTIAYVHDRRGEARTPLAEMPARPLSRHEADELYETILVEALGAAACVLTGPRGAAALPAERYGNLAHDVRRNGGIVLADLDGEPLAQVLEAGVDVLKVSDEQLLAQGMIASRDEKEVRRALHRLSGAGTAGVVVSRGPEPVLALLDGAEVCCESPSVRAVDPSGGGDSLMAGIAAGLARGDDLGDALRLGVAAATLNVTRHGLGTGDRARIERLWPMTRLVPL